MTTQNEKDVIRVLVKAHVCTDWQGCDFAILELSAEQLAQFKTYDQLAQPFTDMQAFHRLSFWVWIAEGWYDETDNILDDLLPEGAVAMILDDARLQQLREHSERVEYPPNGEQACFYGGGYFKLVGYPKHSDDEFYTEDIPFSLFDGLPQQS